MVGRMAQALPATYDPADTEARIYRRWLDAGVFVAPAEPGDRPRFSIVMPPPNVTGRLHMGHAMDNALQDTFVRWHRMRGDATLWVPGTDHAGIATQAVVERRLAAAGEDRRTLGRDAFLQRVWAWKAEYETGIVEQLQRLGCSCDWSRQRFTLDPGLSRAVEEVFVRYHREGLIYRGDYIVNWCPGCGTAISDLEVEHAPEASLLYRIRYPLVGGGELVIATVRPETMLGDTAVAVHPEYARYQGLVVRQAVLPLVGRRIPVIGDAHVDPAFGTGALKVTPAHDADDAAIAGRHGLEARAVIGPDGRLTADAGPAYAGLTVAEARTAVVAALAAEGALVDSTPYEAAVGRCSRCGTVVEPLISRQWFLRMDGLARAAADAVERGQVRFVPDNFTRIFLQWMEQAHDWCISRQIWWGHRIPAYTCASCGHTAVAADAPAVCPECGTPDPARDPDVLDTWFSSALWPFSTLGWPEQTPQLAGYYPTDLLVTGRDILFFWVARMVFSGLHLTGQAPFRTVLLHGLVRDAQGRKMSKSLGNGIDPLEIIDRYGADALRLTLLVGIAPGNDTRFSADKIEGSQRFCNKLWNAARFVLAAVEDRPPAAALPALADRWLASRMARAAAEATAALERLDAGQALAGLQVFVWEEFCDWYLEAAKVALAAGGEAAAAARGNLLAGLSGILRLVHPFLPFVTEEIWGRLPGAESKPLLAASPWPAADEWPADPEAEREFEVLRQVIGAVRSLRAELRVPPAARVSVLVHGGASAQVIAANAGLLSALARVGRLVQRPVAPGDRCALAVVGAGIQVAILADAAVDLAAEGGRLLKELESVRGELERMGARLANPAFRTRARPEVVAREEERQATLEAARTRLEARVAQLEGREGPV